jgi:hypothetical protein
MVKSRDRVKNIIDYEGGEMEDEDVVKMYQSMINDGTAWRFQGSYGRQAMEYIRAGACALGKEGHRDYYGNYVPSRFEVKAGTKGSVEYCEAAGYTIDD